MEKGGDAIGEGAAAGRSAGPGGSPVAIGVGEHAVDIGSNVLSSVEMHVCSHSAFLKLFLIIVFVL